MSPLATILGKILVPETPVKGKKCGLSSLSAPKSDLLNVARVFSCLCFVHSDDGQATRLLKPCLHIISLDFWGAILNQRHTDFQAWFNSG
jgi:hypothetical protein